MESLNTNELCLLSSSKKRMDFENQSLKLLVYSKIILLAENNHSKKIITENFLLNNMNPEESIKVESIINLFINDFNNLGINYNINWKDFEFAKEKFNEISLNYNDKMEFNSYFDENISLNLINNIFMILKEGSFCFKFVEFKYFEDQTNDCVNNINIKLDSLNGLSLIELFNKIIRENFLEYDNKEINQFKDNSFKFWNKFYEIFSCRDCLTMIGIRKTPGSMDCFPIKFVEIIKGFCRLHSELNIKKNKEINEDKKKGKPSILTVGARALSKHHHRSTKKFWPECIGKESKKNEMALIIANKLIENCCWINIHQLPGDLPIMELRVKEGYGLRWQLDSFFRGFLEPQIPDGHEKGWKH